MLLKSYARRTMRLAQHINRIGYALGGNAGSRMASLLGMPIGCSTMLRIIYDDVGDIESVAPRVLGIDDWTFRKGNNYGTILVDLEKEDQ